MTPRPLPPLERVEYVTGCDLLRRDLVDSVAYEARLLALHVAAVHRTWGVGRGLSLTLSPDSASVHVATGFGFTARGEPIALVQRAVATAPTAPVGTMSRPLFDLVLTLAAGPWDPCEAPMTCTGVAAPSHGPQPAVAWVLAGDAAVDAVPPLGQAARDGNTIPLGRFELLAAGTLLGPDLGQRRVARGPARPYVGFTPAGTLDWKAGPFSLNADVDTSSAHFSTTPIYLVSLGSNLWVDPTIVGPLASIAEASSSTSFSLQLVIAPASGPTPPDWLTQLTKQANQLTVSWIGLENMVGCF